jgi:precorrin-6A/cobalt-precorrin-6A reductase
VLILGGTGEARELAAALDADGAHVVSSLAGRVARPRRPPGTVRIGGFGGSQGLARWLTQHRPAAVVDATHPFATAISASAAEACPQAGVPLLRLERPSWTEQPGDRWQWVGDIEAAAAAVSAPATGGSPAARVLLTLGRKEIAAFAALGDAWFLIRSVDPPPPPLPQRHELLLDRGPFILADELELIDRHGIDTIVTRNSGGSSTAAKLDAARLRALPVIVVHRPEAPDVPAIHDVVDAAGWVRERLGRP